MVIPNKPLPPNDIINFEHENNISAKRVTNIARKNSNFWVEVGKGNVDGYSSVFITATNQEVSIEEETVWEVGGRFVAPTSGDSLTLVSDNANDDSGGTGGTSVILTMLDSNYNIIIEIVTLDGLTPVSTISTDIIALNGAILGSSGSSNSNTGTITITHGLLTMGIMLPTESRVRNGFYTVPAGFSVEALNFITSSGKDDELQINARAFLTGVTDSDTLFTKLYNYQTTANLINAIPSLVGEKTRFEQTAIKTGSAGNARVTTIVEFLQIDNLEF